MSKLAICVVIFSLCLIVVFCLMIYLMTTINPAPLSDLEDIDIDDGDPKEERKHMIGETILNDSTEFVLEKVDSEEIDFYQSSHGPPRKYISIENGTGVFRFLHRNAVPPLWPRARETIIVDPTMHIVMPPGWLTTPLQEKSCSTPPSRSKTPVGEYSDYQEDILRIKSKIHTNTTAMKPMRRRSINNVNLLNGTESLILNILNGMGQSLIEIKLSGDNNLQKKKSKGNKRFSKDKSNFTIKLENNNQRKNNKPTKDTIYMTITSNDSIVIDEYDTKSIPESGEFDISSVKDIISLMVLVSSKNKTNKEESMPIPSKTNKMTKVPLNQNNVKVDNETKSFRNLVANSRNMSKEIAIVATENSTHFNVVAKNSGLKYIVNSTTINTIAKNNTTFDTIVKNNTDYDIQFNNSVFMNVLFDDEETNNITSGVINVNKLNNYTTLQNNALSSNHTAVFSENESDSTV